MSITHTFVGTKPDGPDPLDVQVSHWNGTHTVDFSDMPHWEVVMDSGFTNPPDPVLTVDGDDWVYALVTV